MLQESLKIISIGATLTFQAFSMEPSEQTATAPILTPAQIQEALAPYIPMYRAMNSAFDSMAANGCDLGEAGKAFVRGQTFSAINNNAAAWDGTQPSMNQLILQITLESLFSGDTGDDEDGDVDTGFIDAGDDTDDDDADDSGGLGGGAPGWGESY